MFKHCLILLVVSFMLFSCGPKKWLDQETRENAHYIRLRPSVACIPCGLDEAPLGKEYAICKCDYGEQGVTYKKVSLLKKIEKDL